jgi:hypothetical protein
MEGANSNVPYVTIASLATIHEATFALMDVRRYEISHLHLYP